MEFVFLATLCQRIQPNGAERVSLKISQYLGLQRSPKSLVQEMLVSWYDFVLFLGTLCRRIQLKRSLVKIALQAREQQCAYSRFFFKNEIYCK